MELIINWAVNMIQLPDGGTNPDQKQLYLSNKLFSPVHRREKLQCGGHAPKQPQISLNIPFWLFAYRWV
jgi:hypothetical protein